MKKHLLIAGLAVLSTGAYATTARLQALGQDTTRGSFFIDDNYNVFRNAAYVNMYKNYVVTEWGSTNGALVAAQEQLEGGYFREMGAFAYGVYFNNESSTAEGIAQGANPITGTDDDAFVVDEFATSNNAIDLFFGGDMGVQWGARINYQSSKDKQTEAAATSVGSAYDAEHSALGVSLGIMMGDLGAYANIGIKNEYTGSATGATDANQNTDKLEGSGSLNLGVNYKLGDMRVFADYAKGGQEYTDASQTAYKKEWEATTMNIGVGHTHEVSSTARVFTELKYYSKSTEVKNLAANGETRESKDTNLPLTIGFEADANSWLTVRGSVSQTLPFLDKDEFTDSDTTNTNDENTNGSSTAFAAGATLNFGKLKIDGIIGNGTNTDELNTDTLMSKLAVHYHF